MRYHFDVGTVWVYTVETKVVQECSGPEDFRQSQTQHNVMTLTRRVVQIDGAGNGLIVSYLDTTALKIDGEEKPLPPMGVVYMKMSPLGRILEISNPMVRSSIQFPDAPVGPGDRWEFQEEMYCRDLSSLLPLTTIYTLREKNDRELLVEFVSPRVEYESEAVQGVRNGIDNTGRYVYSDELGCLISSEMDTRLVAEHDGSAYEVRTHNSLVLKNVFKEIYGRPSS